MDSVNKSSSCELGRKEYWENYYLKELENFKDHGDEGDIWFGKKNVDRIVNWILGNNIDKVLSILDVGCGNGSTLISLAIKGFTDLTGIDYAAEAIQLAENIANSKQIIVKFKVLDFLKDSDESLEFFTPRTRYHIIIDKGTYDAICLCPDDARNKRLKYVDTINQLLSSTGYFILFSCNWTKEELLQQFIGFMTHDEIEIPSIGFGGKTGQTVTAIILKKIISDIA